jgi:hypothetical protein
MADTGAPSVVAVRCHSNGQDAGGRIPPPRQAGGYGGCAGAWTGVLERGVAGEVAGEVLTSFSSGTPAEILSAALTMILMVNSMNQIVRPRGMVQPGSRASPVRSADRTLPMREGLCQHAVEAWASLHRFARGRMHRRGGRF